MRFSKTLIALVAPFLVSAAPARVYNRQLTDTDVLVVKFAQVLEQLEAQFYEQALAKFQESDFTTAGFPVPSVAIEQFARIGADERTHATVLEDALRVLGSEPVQGCTFDFSSVLGDVTTMAAVARVVEAVGVGAYIGGAVLLSDPRVLAAAGSILPTESRHQTILNIMSGTGTAVPSAFDIGLTPSEVLALAGPFISGCDLGIPSNPVLQITNAADAKPGVKLEFSSPALDGQDRSAFGCQMVVGGLAMSIALPIDECVVPDVNGPVAIFITKDVSPIIANPVQRTSEVVIAGPALAFIDTKPETLGQLVRGNGVVRESVSTRTITPSQASDIIASATRTGTSVEATRTGESESTTGSQASSTSGASSSVTGASSSVTGSNTTSGPQPTIAAQSAALGAPGGPSDFVGPSKDGKTKVLGWSPVPAST